MNNTEKRAHHNAAERKRRQTLKEAYAAVKEVLPTLQGDKAPRGQVLKEATAHIQFMSKRNAAEQKQLQELKSYAKALDDQIALLQNDKTPENMAAAAVVIEKARMALEKPETTFDGAKQGTSSEFEYTSRRILKARPRKQLR